MVTKEQERKVLEQIRKLINSVGEDSYIATAFQGCCLDAERNIEEDAAYCMNERVETLSERLEKMTENYAAAAKELEDLRKKIIPAQDLSMMLSLLRNEISASNDAEMRAAETIVNLADKPDSAEFKQAVYNNRGAHAKAEKLTIIKNRVCEIINA